MRRDTAHLYLGCAVLTMIAPARMVAIIVPMRSVWGKAIRRFALELQFRASTLWGQRHLTVVALEHVARPHINSHQRVFLCLKHHTI